MRVLICGHRAPSAQGLGNLLQNQGWEVEYFSRGTPRKEGNLVEGQALALESNQDLHAAYDAVVNFIVLKGESVESNVAYAEQLVRFCNQRAVKLLIHISSVSVYPPDPDRIDESTAIAARGLVRGEYSTLKSEVDHALLDAKKHFSMALVRPGLILDPSVEPPRAGIVRHVLGRVDVLLGDHRATLPLVQRSDLHLAITRILGDMSLAGVFLAVSPEVVTKSSYAKSVLGVHPWGLPRGPSLFAAKILRWSGVFSDAQLRQVQGLFRRSKFDPTVTQRRLGMEFRS